jgi:hypothetical protein
MEVHMPLFRKPRPVPAPKPAGPSLEQRVEQAKEKKVQAQNLVDLGASNLVRAADELTAVVTEAHDEIERLVGLATHADGHATEALDVSQQVRRVLP